MVAVEGESFLKIDESESASGFVLLSRSHSARQSRRSYPSQVKSGSWHKSNWLDPLVDLRSVNHVTSNRNEISALKAEISEKEMIIDDLNRKLRDLRVVVKDLEGRLHGCRRPQDDASAAVTNSRQPLILQSSRASLTSRTSQSASKLELLRDRMKSGKSVELSHTARPFSSRLRRESTDKPSSKPADEIDEVVQMYLNESDQLGRVKRLAYGVYLLGNKKIAISVKNGKPLVRIGGGAMVHLDVYLVTHS